MIRLKRALAILGAAAMAVLAALFARQSEELAKAKIELDEKKGDDENRPEEKAISDLENKVKADDKNRLQKERALLDDLDGDSNSGKN